MQAVVDLRDTQTEIYQELVSLGDQAYFAAVWLLCREIRRIYADRLPSHCSTLMDMVIADVGRCAFPESGNERPVDMDALMSAWLGLGINDEDPAYLCTIDTAFTYTIHDMSTGRALNAAADWIVYPFEEYFRDAPGAGDPGVVRYDQVEIDTAGRLAGMMRAISEVLRSIREHEGALSYASLTQLGESAFAEAMR